MSKLSASELVEVEEQLRVYGMMKFPPDFMNIGKQPFSWVYDNRPEWVKFSENWKEATGLFKFWYLYVKLRGSIKKTNDKSADGQTTDNSEVPVYTVPVADEWRRKTISPSA